MIETAFDVCSRISSASCVVSSNLKVTMQQSGVWHIIPLVNACLVDEVVHSVVGLLISCHQKSVHTCQGTAPGWHSDNINLLQLGWSKIEISIYNLHPYLLQH